MAKIKYIIIERVKPVTFTSLHTHAEVARGLGGSVTSAGSYDTETRIASGGSSSLLVGSDPGDTGLLRIMMGL